MTGFCAKKMIPQESGDADGCLAQRNWQVKLTLE
jgi:hypothetical protein